MSEPSGTTKAPAETATLESSVSVTREVACLETGESRLEALRVSGGELHGVYSMIWAARGRNSFGIWILLPMSMAVQLVIPSLLIEIAMNEHGADYCPDEGTWQQKLSGVILLCYLLISLEKYYSYFRSHRAAST